MTRSAAVGKHSTQVLLIRYRRAVPRLAAGTIVGGVSLSVAWVAFKVGALSYGGGFVIIP